MSFVSQHQSRTFVYLSRESGRKILKSKNYRSDKDKSLQGCKSKKVKCKVKESHHSHATACLNVKRWNEGLHCLRTSVYFWPYWSITSEGCAELSQKAVLFYIFHTCSARFNFTVRLLLLIDIIGYLLFYIGKSKLV